MSYFKKYIKDRPYLDKLINNGYKKVGNYHDFYILVKKTRDVRDEIIYNPKADKMYRQNIFVKHGGIEDGM